MSTRTTPGIQDIATADLLRQVADYSLALDAMSRMAGVGSEAEAIERVLQLFDQLMSPRRLVYLPLGPGGVGGAQTHPRGEAVEASEREMMVTLAEPFRVEEEAHAFTVRIQRGDEAVGVLKVERVDPLQPLKRYLNLALELRRIVAIIIESARSLDALKASQEALRRAEAGAARVKRSRLLADMATGVAHTFNNLLATILGSTELYLSDRPADAESRTFLARIESACRRGAETCHNMLLFAGDEGLRRAPLDLGGLVRAFESALRRRVPPPAALMLEIEDGLPVIQGDRAALTTLIEQLVINAAESLDDGRGTVTIRIHRPVMQDGSLPALSAARSVPLDRPVCLEVRDTGCGMGPEAMSRAFDPFYSTKLKGRGMGLASAVGVVEGHGGLIRLESRPGQGTVCRVMFPVSVSEKEGHANPC